MAKFFLIMVYLMLELTTSRLGTAIFFEAQTTTSMTRAETLGYISAGIGLSLLLIRKFFANTSFPVRLVFFVCCYISSVHILHKIMEELPERIPFEQKIDSVSAGVSILTTHSPTPLMDAYMARENPLKTTSAAIFIQLFGGSDPELRQWMIEGINQSALFSVYWAQLSRTLNQEKIKELVSVQYQIASNTFASQQNSEWLPILLAREKLYGTRSIPSSNVLYDVIYQNRPWNTRTAAWIGVAQQFPYIEVPAHEKPLDTWPEIIRKGFSEHSLEKYPIAVSIPWSNDTLYDRNYNLMMAEIIPFFFTPKGKPLLDLSLLRDARQRAVFLAELQKPLSPTLEKLMRTYQIENLRALSTDSQAWRNNIRASAGLPLVRLVWVIPFFTVLSYALLIFNLKITIAEWRKKYPHHNTAVVWIVSIVILIGGSLGLTTNLGVTVTDALTPWLGPQPVLDRWM